MRKALRVALRVFLGIVCLLIAAAAALTIRWLATREDPASFLPDRYVAYLQVPSIRGMYEEWLNLEVADVVLSRPELSGYRSAVTEARGLALTGSPILRALLEVHADVMILKGGDILIVLPLGWRGIFTPLARVVAPLLSIQGFSFLNDSGTPMYRYTAGSTTIHAAFVNDVAVISLSADVVKEAIARHTQDTGLAAKTSRELLRRIKLRSSSAVRVLADTKGLSEQLLRGSDLGERVLGALELPGQAMMDVELHQDVLSMAATMPISSSLAQLTDALEARPQPIGILRYAPATTYLLTVSNIAPLSVLYKLVAALEGEKISSVYAQADSGAKAVVGAGIDELLFSWVGSEIGAFMIEGSSVPVFFARIKDQAACTKALDSLTKSIVAGKDSSLVLDGVRVERLLLPWYVKMILDTLGIDVPEPYFITVGDYFLLSLDAANLAAVSRTADTGDNLAHGALYARLAQGIPSDASLLAWYDIERTEPFFVQGTGILQDVMRLYGRGIAAVRATPEEITLTLSAAHAERVGVKPLPGFPLSPQGGVGRELLAFRFREGGAPRLAWMRGDTLVLADAAGATVAEAAIENGSALVVEGESSDSPATIWAVSPGGTIWRYGQDLALTPGFPITTGITGSMPPAIVGDRLALYSKADSAIVLVDGGGERTAIKVDASLFASPDYQDGMLAFCPKSFQPLVHLTDLNGVEVSGWPVEASGISYCSPRIVAWHGSFRVAFLTQSGLLYEWEATGEAVPSFPVQLPGVYYATPEPVMTVDGPALAALSQDGLLSLVALDGTVLRQASVPDIDGKSARIAAADFTGDGRDDILLYGSGAFTAGLDSSLRVLPGFPVKGVSRPVAQDINKDGGVDIITAGLDGRIYGYSFGRGSR